MARTRALSVTERACVGFCNNPAAEGDEWGGGAAENSDRAPSHRSQQWNSFDVAVGKEATARTATQSDFQRREYRFA